MQRPVGHYLPDERVKARLSHRAAAGPDLIDLGGVNVDPPDVMAIGGHACCRDRAHVAKTDHCKLHLVTSIASRAGHLHA